MSRLATVLDVAEGVALPVSQPDFEGWQGKEVLCKTGEGGHGVPGVVQSPRLGPVASLPVEVANCVAGDQAQEPVGVTAPGTRNT